mgnify:CR=1 FL=1
MVGKQDKTYYIMAPSQITDDMKTQAATAYVQFMKTDAYKTYTKAYETFIKKNPGYEDKISEKQECNISRAKNEKNITDGI